MTRWNDGRSGESGRYAGNLVLDFLDPGRDRIENLKGTVFADPSHCWVGRVVGDDEYLSSGVLHWANISSDQHSELSQLVKDTRRQLLYLFVTAHSKGKKIRFWQVPATVLERELRRRGKDARGTVLGLHISERDGRHMLGDEDVTQYHSQISIDAPAAVELTSAVRNDRSKKAGVRHSVEHKPNATPPNSSDTVRHFEIPISDGRTARFSAPVPMTAMDVARVKGYIDLMSDLLT